MNIFNKILRDYGKSQREKCNGKINKAGGHFQLCPDEERDVGVYPNGDNNWDRIRLDFLGRKMKLVKGPSANCFDIDGKKDENAILTNSKKKAAYCSVPMKKCRKCENYIKTGMLKYACCQFLKDKQGSKEVP